MGIRVLILGLLLFFNESAGSMCFRTFEEDTSISNIIFIGQVDTNYEDHFIHDGYPRKMTNFFVLESFKGLRKEINYISILGMRSGGKYRKDSLYIVFAQDLSNCENKSYVFFADDCSYTGLLSRNKELLNKLGKSKKHNGKNGKVPKIILEHRKRAQEEKKISQEWAIDNYNATIEILSKRNSLYKKLIIGLSLLCIILIGLVITRIYRKKSDSETNKNAN